MNNTLYLLRNKKTNIQMECFIKKYNLAPYYTKKMEAAFKTEDFIVLIKKKYIFFRTLSDNNAFFSEVLRYFKGGNHYAR